MSRAEHEGGASYYIQTTTFGKSFVLRNALFAVNVVLAVALLASMLTQPLGAPTLLGWAIVGATAIVTSVIGRALFYVLVIPTTMPGAFFWRNKASASRVWGPVSAAIAAAGAGSQRWLARPRPGPASAAEPASRAAARRASRPGQAAC